MSEEEIIGLIDDTLKEKMKENTNFIRYSFYEVRVKYNLSEKDADIFLKFIRNKLENEDYLVYFQGSRFTYENANRTVQDNEYLIAVKDIK